MIFFCGSLGPTEELSNSSLTERQVIKVVSSPLIEGMNKLCARHGHITIIV